MELRPPRPSQIGLAAGRAVVLAGPAVLAFYAGGYFDGPRLWAALVAWAAVALLALAAPRPLRPSGPALAAVTGLALLAGWVAASIHRAPLEDPAQAELERDLLYLGGLIAAVLALRGVRRAVEPVLALGALVVVGYGLAGRLLPGIVHEHVSASAGGRLDQPLTYWNATGALAAIGVVLCARVAGDRSRQAALRVAAAAAAAPLGLGCYLTFSRGAIIALAAGLLVLLLVAPTWPQLRAAAICAEGAALATLVASQLAGVSALHGARAAEGAAALAVLAAAMLGAAALQAWSVRDERSGAARAGPLPIPRRGRALGWAVAVALAAAPFAVGIVSERGNPAFGATGQRLGSVGSNRYAYWRVAMRVWRDHPLEGAGPASFRAEWQARRPFAETVRDAHSLELETLSQLGLVGLGCLVLLFGGVITALVRADPLTAAGPAAALAVWAVHASVDWDWEMPALTLFAIALAGCAVTLPRAGGRDPA